LATNGFIFITTSSSPFKIYHYYRIQVDDTCAHLKNKDRIITILFLDQLRRLMIRTFDINSVALRDLHWKFVLPAPLEALQYLDLHHEASRLFEIEFHYRSPAGSSSTPPIHVWPSSNPLGVRAS
jgi:hypothetical protein